MNDCDALRQMIDHYPGGREVVALRLDKPWSTLDKELRDAPGFKLGMRTARRISEMCCEADSPYCMAWLTVVASCSGARVERLPLDDVGGDVFPLASESVREVADVASVVFGGKRGAEKTTNGNKRLQKEVAQALDALQRLQRVVGQSEPKAVRHG